MKKVKRFSMEPSPYGAPSYSSSSPYPDGLDARARFRHQSLVQDYVELQKEIEAKREKLLKANKKKRGLVAVVKFLQKKVQSFSKKPSQKVQCRVKKHPLKYSTSSNRHDELPVEDSQEVEVVPVPKAMALLDLNQISLPNGEKMDGFETELKASTILSKRKISWQDQISVRACLVRENLRDFVKL